MLRLTKNYQKLSRLFPHNLAHDTSLHPCPSLCFAHATEAALRVFILHSLSAKLIVEGAITQRADCQGARQLRAVAC